jgi:hypothetical protein
MGAISASVIVSEAKPVTEKDGSIAIAGILIQFQKDFTSNSISKEVWITAFLSSEDTAPPLDLRFEITRPVGSTLGPWSKAMSIAGGWYLLNVTLHPGHLHFERPGPYKMALFVKNQNRKKFPTSPAAFCLIDAVHRAMASGQAEMSA